MDGIASVILFAAGTLAGGAVGFFIARLMRGGDTVPKPELEQARAENQILEARLEERADKYKADIQGKQDELRDRDGRIADLTRELQEYREKAVTLQTEKESLAQRINDHKTDLERMQEKLQLSFETLSHKIFEDKAVKFKQQSKESLSEILTPLSDKLADFQKKVNDSFGKEAEQRFALKEEIKRIVDVNEKMMSQTDNLAKALRGDSRVQGNWGEVMLEKILIDSGLRKNEDYVLQGADLGMKHAESGQTQKPDVVVKLPDNKHIIIDSKVSLVHYERYCGEEDEAQRAEYLRQFLASVRTHVGDLEERRYQDTDKLGTPDFVLMFMPIEGAYALAVQQDRTLQSYAWDRKVVLVCPATLFASLRTIASLWRLEAQNRNAMEIAIKGGELYDKIVGFAEDMKKLGDQIGKVDDTYKSALGKLKDGRGNMLKKAEDLKKLGAKAAKSLPIDLIQADVDEAEETPPFKKVENG